MKAKRLTALSIASIALAVASCSGQAQEPSRTTVQYIANEGIMIEDARTKILFDPLFENSFNIYRMPSREVKQQIIKGEAPYDMIDAVFISHYHGDHFSPSEMLDMMLAQPNLKLIAPAQAIDALKSEPLYTSDMENRLHTIALEYKDPPITFSLSDMEIGAVRIPHAGWPDGRLDVQNIAFRVTLKDGASVVHLGDADTRPQHYALNPDYWASVELDAAFPPYWYFGSKLGLRTLEEHLKANQNIGIHVPVEMPSEQEKRPAPYNEVDLFPMPGETRTLYPNQ